MLVRDVVLGNNLGATKSSFPDSGRYGHLDITLTHTAATNQRDLDLAVRRGRKNFSILLASREAAVVAVRKSRRVVTRYFLSDEEPDFASDDEPVLDAAASLDSEPEAEPESPFFVEPLLEPSGRLA
jgi:hypothetical protein